MDPLLLYEVRIFYLIYCRLFLLIDPNLKDQGNQQSNGSQLPKNMMQQQQMNVMPQVNAQHQPMNIFPYPVGVHPPMMNMPQNPFNIHPPMPMHLPTEVPLIQVAAPTNLFLSTVFKESDA